MRIFSIFTSINGEVNINGIGSMTIFIRTAGCTANCAYCDSRYANEPDSGKEMTIKEILAECKEQGPSRVTITGGEPMEQQEELKDLIVALRDEIYEVTIETNGAHSFDRHMYPWSLANWVVDIKHPLNPRKPYVEMGLRASDYFKMVVSSKEQFKGFCKMKEDLMKLGSYATFAFGPCYGETVANEIVWWMKEFGEFDSVLNFQAHKVLPITEAD
jgi:7-carboxy-7-deazaguanine synthase